MAKGTGTARDTKTAEKPQPLLDSRGGEGVDELTLEALAQMELDERMSGSRLQELLRLLEDADLESRDGAARELVRRGVGDAEIRLSIRDTFRTADAPLRLRARTVLLQIDRRERAQRQGEVDDYYREQEALEEEARRRLQDADSCKEEAAQYELEIRDWKKAGNEHQEQGAHARVALARREAGEELRQARLALRDALDAYFDATDAAAEPEADARHQRRQHAQRRQQRRLARRQQDYPRDRLEVAPATVVLQTAVSAVEAAPANRGAAASSP